MSALDEFKNKLAEITALTTKEDAHNWVHEEFESLLGDLLHIRDIVKIDVVMGIKALIPVPVLEAETPVYEVQEPVVVAKGKKAKAVDVTPVASIATETAVVEPVVVAEVAAEPVVVAEAPAV